MNLCHFKPKEVLKSTDKALISAYCRFAGDTYHIYSGKATQISHGGNSHWDNKVYKTKHPKKLCTPQMCRKHTPEKNHHLPLYSIECRCTGDGNLKPPAYRRCGEDTYLKQHLCRCEGEILKKALTSVDV